MGTSKTPVRPRRGAGLAVSLLVLCLGAWVAVGPASAADEALRQAQQALQSKGYAPGPADGVMGGKTRRALRQFQKRQGLPETGELDRRTARHLGIRRAGTANRARGDSGTDYRQCVRDIVDAQLAQSKNNVIRSYVFSNLPDQRGFAGYVAYRNGSLLRISEEDQGTALNVFTQLISGGAPGVDRAKLKAALQNGCTPRY